MPSLVAAKAGDHVQDIARAKMRYFASKFLLKKHALVLNEKLALRQQSCVRFVVEMDAHMEQSQLSVQSARAEVKFNK
jgi:hypothetical protein